MRKLETLRRVSPTKWHQFGAPRRITTSHNFTHTLAVAFCAFSLPAANSSQRATRESIFNCLSPRPSRRFAHAVLSNCYFGRPVKLIAKLFLNAGSLFREPACVASGPLRPTRNNVRDPFTTYSPLFKPLCHSPQLTGSGVKTTNRYNLRLLAFEFTICHNVLNSVQSNTWLNARGVHRTMRAYGARKGELRQRGNKEAMIMSVTDADRGYQYPPTDRLREPPCVRRCSPRKEAHPNTREKVRRRKSAPPKPVAASAAQSCEPRAVRAGG